MTYNKFSLKPGFSNIEDNFYDGCFRKINRDKSEIEEK